MRGLRFWLLGSFDVTSDERGHVAPVEGRKAQELITFLLLVPGQAKSRDAAVDALWPEAPPETGRKHIRQSLWRIHQAVDGGAPPDERLVIADVEHLAVNRARAPWCDAIAFAEAVESVGSRPRHAHGDRRLEQALDLYRGPLLDGCYAEWCLVERERLEALYLSALDTASVQAEARGDFETAVSRASALLRLDPAHERSHRRLMRLYYLMDDRTRALRQFDRCCHALETELDIKPSSRTVAVASAIRDDVAPPGLPEASDAVGAASLNRPDRSALLHELAALHEAVEDLRRSVHERLA